MNLKTLSLITVSLLTLTVPAFSPLFATCANGKCPAQKIEQLRQEKAKQNSEQNNQKDSEERQG